MGQLALPLIGVALSAGGGALNGIQQQQYQAAVAKSEQDAYKRSRQARLDEQGRQDAFGREAQDFLNTTQAAITPEQTEANADTAAQDFMSLYDERGSSQPEGQYLSPGGADTTDLIRTETAKRAATAAADARSRVSALAKIGSFDTAMQQNGLALQNNSALLNTLGGMRRGSLGVSNQEQNIGPTQVMPGDNLLGPLMSAAGSFVSAGSGIPGGFGGFTVPAATGVPAFNWGPFSGFAKLLSGGK